MMGHGSHPLVMRIFLIFCQIITDPDLEFNDKLPKNFVEILAILSDKYKCQKIGFALDISDCDKMYADIYLRGKTIHDWEIKFWARKIQEVELEMEYEFYKASIDTTFCLYNKKGTAFNIRIAGDFIAKHLPWYINIYENYLLNTTNKSFSTTSNSITSYIDSNF